MARPGTSSKAQLAHLKRDLGPRTVFLNKYRRFCQLVYLHKHHLTSFYSPHSDAGVLGPRSLFRWASCAFEEVPGQGGGTVSVTETV